MFRWVLTLMIPVLLPASFGQYVAPPKDLPAAEEKFRKAVLTGDADALAAILTDDFIRSPPGAPDTTKAQYVNAIRSGQQKYLSIEVKDEKYRVYGDMVLVNIVQDVRVLRSGQPSNSKTRALFVWIKQNGRWLLAAIQGNTAP